LIADAVKMRHDMAKHKPPAGPFDVKLIEGGLVDCEFAVHLTQLRYRTGFDANLPVAIAALAEAGLVSAALRDAHALLARLLVTLRLVSPDADVPPEVSRSLVAMACGAADWPALEAAYAAARATVSAEWHRASAILAEG
jgi:glutamate-ammonia-ligase adenylyltransferase